MATPRDRLLSAPLGGPTLPRASSGRGGELDRDPRQSPRRFPRVPVANHTLCKPHPLAFGVADSWTPPWEGIPTPREGWIAALGAPGRAGGGGFPERRGGAAGAEPSGALVADSGALVAKAGEAEGTEAHLVERLRRDTEELESLAPGARGAARGWGGRGRARQWRPREKRARDRPGAGA
ncbi:unnamed protein product [Prorocentrum cordatum]|uniref:Uncharacterized protein n=1 Tax=Prorocentrum cordatum TaxID=2364126 RepID=A0ABN9XE89_9DINO|nr:unnamed protein product [Polarella glacialis]